MSTLLEELSAIKTEEDKVVGNKVANFAYDDYAYEHNDANGVDTYNVNNHQNVPNASANILKVNATVLTKGWRAQASAITRMLMNHFLGRCSYNLNKVHDHFSGVLNNLVSFIGQPNGIAVLDANGKLSLSQLSNVYDIKKPVWTDIDLGFYPETVHFADNMWVVGGFSATEPKFAWSEDGLIWNAGSISETVTGGVRRVQCIHFADGLWLAGDADGRIYRSTDGKNWNKSYTASYGIDVIRYHAGVWYIGAGTYLIKSVDEGITWQTVKSNLSARLADMLFTDTVFLLMTSSDTNTALYSTDSGAHWSVFINSVGTGAGIGVRLLYAKDVFIACTSKALFYSTNGTTYSVGLASNNIGDVIYHNGLFITVCSEGTYISEDGKIWTPTTSSDLNIKSIQCGEGIALGSAFQQTKGDFHYGGGLYISLNGNKWRHVSGYFGSDSSVYVPASIAKNKIVYAQEDINPSTYIKVASIEREDNLDNILFANLDVGISS